MYVLAAQNMRSICCSDDRRACWKGLAANGGELAACHPPVSGCKSRIMARVSADLLSLGLLIADRPSIELAHLNG
jgi:hypothetical protein